MASLAQRKKLLFDFLVTPLVVLAAAFLRAVCVVVFIVPYEFAPGGITGIATMVEYATDGAFSSGWTLLILNAPILLFAFFLLNKPFAIKSAAATVISSVTIVIMQRYGFPVYENGEPVLAAMAAGVLGGIALAMLLKVGGSNGGTDVIATFIQRKFSATHVAWIITGLDAIVVFVSGFVYDNSITPILMSLVEMFCSAMTSDVITSGFKTALKYEIITHDPEALSDELIHKLRRGVTCVRAKGMYSQNDTYLLICVIRKRQLSEFNNILKRYPDTFAYVTNTSEVMGLGFSRFAEMADAAGVTPAGAPSPQEQADAVGHGPNDEYKDN